MPAQDLSVRACAVSPVVLCHHLIARCRAASISLPAAAPCISHLALVPRNDPAVAAVPVLSAALAGNFAPKLDAQRGRILRPCAPAPSHFSIEKNIRRYKHPPPRTSSPIHASAFPALDACRVLAHTLVGRVCDAPMRKVCPPSQLRASPVRDHHPRVCVCRDER
ncbi:hypothetical protein WOLCODRAFT_163495 [Wolfiporia cocos MD-104 SS10]|uniref:Uncharacterized protein n=1 Tax=Wolfiporia cocos (strain MD-104) TaxID=742152 RepID=A0A2H3JJP2_WOLCO|nr:hypothetical protein WOLCODRAFT_163495 [Wolfiporia cocos MD-104 SS10]